MTVRGWIGGCLMVAGVLWIAAGFLWPAFLVMWWRRKRFEGVQILRLEPGDVLVFASRKMLTKHSAEVLSELLRETFPDHKTVVAEDLDVRVIRGPKTSA